MPTHATARISYKRLADKLLAEWFWVDRWTGSSAFHLPIEPRGLYREMLAQAWRRGARLPNNHEAIRRITGTTLEEWTRCWPLIEGYWRVDGHSLVNDTQLTVYAEAQRAVTTNKQRAKAAADARWHHAQASPQASTQALLEQCPPSPSPSPSQSPNPIANLENKLVRNSGASNKAEKPAPPKNNGNGHDARSGRPIFTGQRLTIFEWMLDDCMKTLGPLTNKFDLHEWFFTLDAHLARTTAVIPKRDNGRWLQEQLVAEAKRRGLPVIATTDRRSKSSGNTESLKAFVAKGRPQ